MKLVATLFFVLILCNSKAQIVLNYFVGIQINNTIKLDWQIKEGSTCNGIQIQRYNGNSFIEIGNVLGLCGSPSSPVSYSFVDNSPINFQNNTYRLTFGGTEISDTIIVFYYTIEHNKIVVNPNPVVSESILYINADSWQGNSIDIIGLNGQVMSSFILTAQTVKLNEIFSVLPRGNYIITLKNNGNPLATSRINW